MLKKLSVRLTFIILLVGMLSALLVAIVQQVVIANAVLQFTTEPNVQTLTLMLAGHHEINGELSDLDVLLGDRDRNVIPPHGPIAVLNEANVIVYGEGGFVVGENYVDDGTAEQVPIMSQGREVGTLVLAPIEIEFESIAVQNFLWSIRMASVVGFVVALIISVILATGFAQRLTSPIKALTQAARRMAAGDLKQEVTIRSQDEIGELATAFNQMGHDLDQSITLRKQMTADIAHDLCTPLAVLLGYTEPLKDGKLDPSPKLFTIMHDEAAYLKYLIGDLHTLATADSGELSLSCQLIQPETLIEDARNAYLKLAERKNIALEVANHDQLPNIKVDPVRMTQVLNNLLMNAISYTPNGGQVTLSAKLQTELNVIRLTIADTGQGIPADDLPYIFERFYRGDKARSRSNGATNSGLGLAIARSIVEAHGGEICVESEVDHGSTFVIQMPIA